MEPPFLLGAEWKSSYEKAYWKVRQRMEAVLLHCLGREPEATGFRHGDDEAAMTRSVNSVLLVFKPIPLRHFSTG